MKHIEAGSIPPLRDKWIGKTITIQRDVISGQSKGCALCIQFRYTRLMVWAKRKLWRIGNVQ